MLPNPNHQNLRASTDPGGGWGGGEPLPGEISALHPSYKYVSTVEPLYCGYLGDLMKCPV